MKRCPNGFHKTKKGCVENSTARNNRTRKSPRQWTKYFIIKGTVKDLSQFIFELRQDPYPPPNYPGRIAKASITRLTGKIEDELAKGNVNVKIDRDDLFIINNTIVGSRWIDKLDIEYLERTKNLTPRRRSPLRKSPIVHRYSPRDTPKMYVINSTVTQFKLLVSRLSRNPKTASISELVAKVSVKRLIGKLQVSINENVPTVVIDRDDLFTLENTEEGRKWDYKITALEIPVSPSPLYIPRN
jgi:hypothetical protein